jgi:AraC-like DNA-binding protein
MTAVEALTVPPSAPWLIELPDPSVGRALDHLHDRPAHGWTVRQLARQSGMSRSVLAERFNRLVGVPPMQYLAQWRMLLAATLLSNTSLTRAEIAARVGYGSETAFTRAYKRWAGVAPSAWRGVRPCRATRTGTPRALG